MFKCKMNAQDFKTTIKATTSLLDEVDLVLDYDKITIKAMDVAHVAYVDIVIPQEECQYYASDNHVITVDLEVLRKITDRIDKDDELLELELIDEETKLRVKIEKKTFDISTYAGTKPTLSLPNVVFINEFEVETNELLDSIKDNELANNVITFEINDNALYIKAKGDLLKSSVEVIETNEELLDCKSIFAISYIKDIIKALPKDTKVMLSIGDDTPIQFSMNIGEITFKYFVAPRKEE